MAAIETNGRGALGMDVGKASRWACMITAEREVMANRPVESTDEAPSRLFSGIPGNVLVVVDRRRNIGALPIRMARAAGLGVAHLPGLAAHQASRMFAGDAKTDERDAFVIARAAVGIPEFLLPVPLPGPALDAARSMAACRTHLVAGSTRDKNGLRSVLLESCSAFEAACGLSDGATLAAMSSIGGSWAMLDAGAKAVSTTTGGMRRRRLETALEAVASCTRPPKPLVEAENPQARMLAKRISEAVAEADRLDGEISRLLQGAPVCRCLLTIPGIGSRTASELVMSIDIDAFPDHDRLASCCGVAPRNRQSGTSISSVTASRQGSKRLKNLLIFSCNSLSRSKGRFGAYYRKCRSRGMCHGEAPKAVARKRMKVIYAIMRGAVPYSE